MKVGFDISQIAHIGGVTTYTENITSQLSKTTIDMVYFYFSLRKPYNGKLSNVKKFFLPPTLSEFIFNRVRKIPIELFIGDIDIFHSSDWIQPPTKAKKITTYHDVVPIKYPQWSHPKIIEVHKRRLEIVEKEIDIVIAVSESTKRDLLELTKIPENKIKVIYEAAEEQFKPSNKELVEDFRKKMKLPDKFILAIGGVGERRNLARIKKVTQRFNLVITGETIPWVKAQELPLLYSAAEVLLYPSLYEGFGLPILEAMSCGTPVITSNISSMPEVGGDAALYVNPEDEGDISKKLQLLMKDEQLRKTIADKGFKQAQRFSWTKCAEETFGIYKRLINPHA